MKKKKNLNAKFPYFFLKSVRSDKAPSARESPASSHACFCKASMSAMPKKITNTAIFENDKFFLFLSYSLPSFIQLRGISYSQLFVDPSNSPVCARTRGQVYSLYISKNESVDPVWHYRAVHPIIVRGVGLDVQNGGAVKNIQSFYLDAVSFA